MNDALSYSSWSVLLDPSPTPNPSPGSGAGGSAQRWLTDPLGTERQLLRQTWAVIADAAHTLAPVAAAAILGALVTVSLVRWRRRRAWRRARAGARWVEVDPPPSTATTHGQELWRELTGLLRPGALGARARLLSWELHAEPDQVRARLWAPATVDAEDVAQALSGTYDRCRVRIAAPGAVTSQPARPSAGYVVVPHRSMWQPLLAEPSSTRAGARRSSSTWPSADPLDGLWLALAGTPRGYRMTVQVLVRPLTRRMAAQARRIRRAAGDRGGPGPRRNVPEVLLAGLAGAVTGVLAAFLDLLTPGPSSRGARARPSGRSHPVALDPLDQQERRTAAAKASAELMEVCLRIVVTGPDRVRCRQLAWRAANSLRRVVTAQATDTLRLPNASRRVQDQATGNGLAIRARGRRPGHHRGWFVATDAELGALARLPHRPARFRFATAGAPHLAAPFGLPRIATADPRTGPGADPEVA